MAQNNIIQQELKDLRISFPEVSMPFEKPPADYFNLLSGHILSEIKTDDLLANLPKKESFWIPNNYFEALHNDIISTVKQDDFIHHLPTETPFSVSHNYFENLSDEIIQNIRRDEFLATLPTQPSYELPPHYFETLADEIISKTSTQNKVSPLTATRTFYGKLAIAASLFVILSLGFLFMIQNPHAVNVENQLAQVSDAEISSYIQEHSYEFDNELSFQSVDESKIDLNKLENDVYNAYFDNISNEEINNFL